MQTSESVLEASAKIRTCNTKSWRCAQNKT